MPLPISPYFYDTSLEIIFYTEPYEIYILLFVWYSEALLPLCSMGLCILSDKEKQVLI